MECQNVNNLERKKGVCIQEKSYKKIRIAHIPRSVMMAASKPSVSIVSLSACNDTSEGLYSTVALFSDRDIVHFETVMVER